MLPEVVQKGRPGLAVNKAKAAQLFMKVSLQDIPGQHLQADRVDSVSLDILHPNPILYC